MTFSARNFILTFYKLFDIEHFDIDHDSYRNLLRYAIFAKEVCPTTNKEHIHGYIETTKVMRVAGVKKLFNDNELHVEQRRGTRDQAIAYVKKEGKFFEYGEPPKQGNRTDLIEVSNKLKSGCKLSTIIEEDTPTYIKFHKGIEKVRGHYLKKESTNFRKVETWLFWGKTGTGKTRKAFEIAGKDFYKLDCANNVWFDGYDGEKTLIIDDFYGWVKFGSLLNLLDDYQLRLEVKGAFTYANWERVIITSNKPHTNWYKDLNTIQIEALERRLNHIHIFMNGEEKIFK